MARATEVPLSVGDALALARAAGLDRLDAQLLLAHCLDRSRAWLLAHGDAPLESAAQSALRSYVERRARGEPLAYLVGAREFHGLVLQVNADVLIPRPDTETLVDWAIELLTGPIGQGAPQVVDLGTGSGAIALAVKQGCPRAQVHATDRSAAALAVARSNSERLALPLACHLGDWWHALPSASVPRVHLALANPPYIAAADPHLADLAFEPLEALVSGVHGLSDLERIVAGAPPRLQPGAWLLLEHGFDQAAAVRGLLASNGFDDIATRQDLGGQSRVSGGRYWPPGG